MAYPKPKDCFAKWVTRPAELADWLVKNSALLPKPLANAIGGDKGKDCEPKIYEHKKGAKGHATMFVCDLSDLHTSLAKKTAEKGWTENNLHEPPNKVKKANWDEMLKRLA